MSGDATAGAGADGLADTRPGGAVDALPDGEPDAVPADARASWRTRAGVAVRERLPLWAQAVQARCGLERRSVIALVVVLVAGAVFAAQHFWTGRTQPVRAPELVRAAPPEPRQETDGRPGARTTGSPSAAGGTAIVVDVTGKVHRPGLQRLPAGSRVADALRAAGGVRPGVSTDGLNRARLLVDGEQVIVGGPASAVGAGPAGVAGVSGAGDTAAGAGAGTSATPVNLNSATLDQLDALPGVGPVLAQHIIDYRTQHGGFSSVDELREVNGIGDRRFSDLQHLVGP
jgi:competence protein ComEA